MESFFNAKKEKIIITSSVLVVVIISEIFFRQPLFDTSVKFISSIHESYTNEKSALYGFSKFLSFLPKEVLMALSLLIVYNFCNILKTFVLVLSLYLSIFIVCFLKIIYQSPRPVWVSDKIMNLSCEGGFGNPSGHSYSAFLFFLTIYEISINQNNFFNRDDNLYKKSFRIFMFVFTVILAILVCLSRVVLGVHSINQIIYGSILGIITYIFIFYVFFEDLNKGDFLLDLIKNNFMVYNSAVVISITIISIFLTAFYRNWEINGIYFVKAKTICPDLHDYKLLFNESILGFVASFSYLAVVLGIYLEYKVIYEEKDNYWIRKQFGYNQDKIVKEIYIEKSYVDNDPENPINSDNNDKNPDEIDKIDNKNLVIKFDLQNDNHNNSLNLHEKDDTNYLLIDTNLIWSNTMLKHYFFRFLILIVGALIFAFPALFISGSSSLEVVYTLKYGIPMFCVQFYNFFIFKLIIFKLRLINEEDK